MLKTTVCVCVCVCPEETQMRFLTIPCRSDAFKDPGARGAVLSAEKSRGQRAALQTLEERWLRRLTALVSRAPLPLEVSACAVVMAPNEEGYLHRLSFGKGHY